MCIRQKENEMKPVLKNAFESEMTIAKTLYAEANWPQCFHHLERAHVLSQRNAWPHTLSHWWMLKVGIRTLDSREIIGQVIRIAVAGIGSLLGKAPVGNTGGANVGIMTPMKIPGDLEGILQQSHKHI